MIDRASRDRLASALRHYVSGQITNDDLDEISIDWRDRGAIAVKERSWGLYTDTHQHKAVGHHHINKPARDEIARWILFLQSDCEYLWPDYHFDQIVNWPMNLITFGGWERNKHRILTEFMTAGDYSAWPFIDQSEYQSALESPRYLAGQRR